MPDWVPAHQAHSRVLNINFDFFIVFGGTLSISHEQFSTDGKVLSHFGFKLKVLPGPLTDLSGRVGVGTSTHCRVSNINFDIFDLFWAGPYEYPMNNCLLTAKFFLTWALRQRLCPGL